MDAVIALEQNDDQFWDDLQSCRKSKNQPKPQSGYTGGVNGWFTCNGFILKLKQNVCRETPTEIIADTFDIFTGIIDRIAYYQKMQCFGMNYSINAILIIYTCCFCHFYWFELK